MTDLKLPKRVLIIGAGFRSANNFLPTFALRPDLFKVVGIKAKSIIRSEPLGKRWDVPVVSSIETLDPQSVDIVAVTVPPEQNASVLKSVLRWNPSALLAIDTPVARKYSEYRELLPVLRQFRAVVVAEDFMNFPQFALMRRAAADGVLGRVRSVAMFNTGYRYHGLALMRSFAKLAPVIGSVRTKLGSYSSVLSYRFLGGIRGYSIGPYRQLITGGVVVEGDNGIITQSPEDEQFADISGRKVFRLTRVYSNGHLSEFRLDGSEYRIETPEIEAMSHLPFDDHSELNVLKNIGLVTIFKSLMFEDELNRAYGYEQAFYDSFTTRLTHKGLLPYDPFVNVGLDFMALPRFMVTRSLSPQGFSVIAMPNSSSAA